MSLQDLPGPGNHVGPRCTVRTDDDDEGALFSSDITTAQRDYLLPRTRSNEHPPLLIPRDMRVISSSYCLADSR